MSARRYRQEFFLLTRSKLFISYLRAKRRASGSAVNCRADCRTHFGKRCPGKNNRQVQRRRGFMVPITSSYSLYWEAAAHPAAWYYLQSSFGDISAPVWPGTGCSYLRLCQGTKEPILERPSHQGRIISRTCSTLSTMPNSPKTPVVPLPLIDPNTRGPGLIKSPMFWFRRTHSSDSRDGSAVNCSHPRRAAASWAPDSSPMAANHSAASPRCAVPVTRPV